MTQLHNAYIKMEGKGVNQYVHKCIQQKQLAAWALGNLSEMSTPSHCLVILFIITSSSGYCYYFVGKCLILFYFYF